MDERYDVVVIGAGAGGLAAALELSSAGRSVLVIEAGPEEGGKIGRAEHEGVWFDTGPSVLTMVDVIADLLKSADTNLEDEFDLIESSTFRYHWPDGMRLDVAFSPEETLANTRDVLGADAAEQLAAFLAYAREIWDAAAPNFVYGPAPSVGSIAKLGLRSLGLVRKIDPMRSMERGIARFVSEPHLRDVLQRYATYNGSDPRQAPATLNCIAHVELGLGCYGISGGMFELARTLRRLAESKGAQFRFGTRVESIETDGRRVTRVVGDGLDVAAEQVVFNGDVATLDALLPRIDPGVTVAEPPSMSGWTGIVKARRRQHDDRPGHAVLFPEAYVDEFRDIFDRGRPPKKPTVYVCAQEKAHGRAGWDDHEPLFIMANAPPEPSSGATPDGVWDELRDTARQRLVRAGLIDDDDAIVWTRTPVGLAHRFRGSRGAIYGAASNSQFAAFQRAPNRLGDVHHLYLASGSAHPGGGVPMCILSGRAAAKAALSDRPDERAARGTA
jgi:phytoene desaturase